MKPEQLRDKFFVSVARKDGTIEVRVGITLKAIVRIDNEEQVDEATELAKNDIINGVYGGRREELRLLVNDLLRLSNPKNTDYEYVKEWSEAKDKLAEFQKTL